jgi:hypothetical protein
VVSSECSLASSHFTEQAIDRSIAASSLPQRAKAAARPLSIGSLHARHTPRCTLTHMLRHALRRTWTRASELLAMCSRGVGWRQAAQFEKFKRQTNRYDD